MFLYAEDSDQTAWIRTESSMAHILEGTFSHVTANILAITEAVIGAGVFGQFDQGLVCPFTESLDTIPVYSIGIYKTTRLRLLIGIFTVCIYPEYMFLHGVI